MFFKIMICITLYASAGYQAFAAPYDDKYQIFPVRLDKNFRSNSKIQYALPCGASLAGIVVIPDAKSWQLGAAVALNRFQCARFPEVKELALTSLKLKKDDLYESVPRTIMRANVMSRFVADWRMLKTGDGRVLELVHEDSCGQNGLLINGNGRDTVNIAVLDIRSDTKNCPYKQKNARIDFIKLTPTTNLSIVHGESRNLPLDQRYDLRLVPVKKKSVRQSRRRAGTQLKYLSRCNETPVGMVSRALKRDKNGSPHAIGVGMLVARFYNMKCNNKAVSWKKYESRFLNLPSHMPVLYLKPSLKNSFDRLTVRLPKEYRVLKKAGGLRLKYYGGCHDEMGWIHSNDSYKNFSVAILTKRRDRNCAKIARVVSKQQPWFNNPVALAKVFPLRLSGFYYLQ